MDLVTFKRILTAFADKPADVDVGRGTLLLQLRDEVVEAKLFYREGGVWVEEEGIRPVSAFQWIVERVARVPLLADRILSYVEDESHFVRPDGRLLDQIDVQPTESDGAVVDAVESIESVLSRNPAGVSTVLYLTSDAGEGKTTVINHQALVQAKKFKLKQTDWLLIPIRLGARPFMRLDDIVVAELANKLRFMLFYDAFLELVRLNVLVPALDGFEEVFLESGTGEAVSALGNLINDLEGNGRVLIAARKAYFEIRSFAAQSRFFDTVTTGAADFARVALQRWSRGQFEEYARRRGVEDPAGLFQSVAERIGPDHPLLSRAVLVERLVLVSLDNQLLPLLDRLGDDPDNYFFEFVDTIVQREATKKWIDRVGDAAEPLLTIAEHHKLLAMIAREMWVTGTSALRYDYLDLIAEVFCTEERKSPAVTRQVKERLHQHSLLINIGKGGRQIGFDHEDFQRFFLGQALARELMDANESGLVAFLRVASLPDQTADAAVNRVRREGVQLEPMVQTLIRTGEAAPDTSYTKENAALLLIRLVGHVSGPPFKIVNLFFPAEALRGRLISNIAFTDCHFQPTSLVGSTFTQIEFSGCQFERLEVGASTRFVNVTFRDCEIGTLVRSEHEDVIYEPLRIRQILRSMGSNVRDAEEQVQLEIPAGAVDDETELAQQALRAFMRATHVNENVFKQRLGTRSNEFFARVLPPLIDGEVLEEVEYRGGGRQRRFKLQIPMKNIEPAIREATSMTEFIKALKAPPKSGAILGASSTSNRGET